MPKGQKVERSEQNKATESGRKRSYSSKKEKKMKMDGNGRSETEEGRKVKKGLESSWWIPRPFVYFRHHSALESLLPHSKSDLFRSAPEREVKTKLAGTE